MSERAIRPVVAAAVLTVLAGVLSSPATAGRPPHWVGAWASSSQAGGPAATDKSYRSLVHLSADGSGLRLRFSNRYGTAPVRISDVHVGLPVVDQPTAALQADTMRRVSFDGESNVVLPVGADLRSDPLTYPVQRGTYLAVSFFAPGSYASTTFHNVGMTTSWETQQGAGNHAADPAPSAFTAPTLAYTYLNAVEVAAPREVSTVVALGDSITDCCWSVPNTNRRWTDLLNDRFAAAPGGQRFSVVNAGIIGNNVSNDRDGNALQGEAGVTRMAADVLDVPNVSHVIVYAGINDIGTGVDAAAIQAAYLRIVQTAHDRGIRVVVATLTPCRDAVASGDQYVSNAAVRDQVNAWVEQNASRFDGVIPFSRVVEDPLRPGSWLQPYTLADQLHPSPAGLEAMAASIDLTLFKARR